MKGAINVLVGDIGFRESSARFYDQLLATKQGLGSPVLRDKVVVYNNFSVCNEDRLGSLQDLQHGAGLLTCSHVSSHVSGPVLVLAGDTLLSTDFSVAAMLAEYSRRKASVIGSLT